MSLFLQQLAGGQLTAMTILLWTLLALVVSLAGGAVAGIRLAGSELGASLAGMMGGMFGVAAGVPGVLLGLIVLMLR